MLAFHPYADLFPLIEGSEFAELVADIKANDLRERIVVWDGAVLDGRNRYRAALAAGLIDEDDGADRAKYFVRFVPAVDGDPLGFVFSKNLHRRHLTIGQRAYAMAEYERFRHGGARSQDANLHVETRAELAEKGHVSERSVASAAVVRDHGVDDLKEAVKRAAVPISVAEKIARMPEQQQPAELAKHLPNGSRAIMGSRREPDDSFDYFPTPPWATRALIECVLRPHLGVEPLRNVWEPACGEGHMAEALSEYFDVVQATDIFDYGYGTPAIDFLQANVPDFRPEWIITNPPFGEQTEQFVLRALDRASIGVAIFARLQWLESVGRYEAVFRDRPPTIIAFFAERVNLCKGRWEPEGSTATAYIWLIWIRGSQPRAPVWIPPGQRVAFSRDDDAQRFTAHPVTRRAVTDESIGNLSPSIDPDTGEIEPTADSAIPAVAVVEPACDVVDPAARAGSISPADELPDIPEDFRRDANNRAPWMGPPS